MKKIIIADRIWQGIGFEIYQNGEDVQIFKTSSNEDVLNVHLKNKADLIITELYRTGLNTVELCSLIRETPGLKNVSVIVCPRNNDTELSQSRKCRANAVLQLPLAPGVLRRAVQQLLLVPARAFYRIPLSARCQKQSFKCEAENISITGMLIEAKADLSRGDKICFTLNLPYAGSFETQAEVVRAAKAPGHRWHYGLRFSRLEPTARYAIKTIVDLIRLKLPQRFDGSVFG